MNMLESLNIVVEYIEENLKNDINLEEMAKFLERYNLPRIFFHRRNGNMNRLITSNELKL